MFEDEEITLYQKAENIEKDIVVLNMKFDNLVEVLNNFLTEANQKNLVLQNMCLAISNQLEILHGKMKDHEISLYNQGISIEECRNDYHSVMNEIHDVKNKIDNLKVYSVIDENKEW